jgi:hypothetical protein
VHLRVVSQTVVVWRTWHNAYDDPDSGLGQRLGLVQQQVCDALDRIRPGPVQAISMCAGQGHDLIGALAGHERRADVGARLVELDQDNVAVARAAAHAQGLDGVEVIAADASLTDAYTGAVPADLVLVCGVFGNIPSPDIQRTIGALPQLCAEGATVIWTRHRMPPDITPTIRCWFADAGFDELAFEADRSQRFAVGTQRFTGTPVALCEGERLFEFVGFWATDQDG